MAAPVCPISRSQPVSDQAGMLVPVVTPAIDLPSALQAVRQLQNLLLMLGKGRPVNNVYPPALMGIGQIYNGSRGGAIAGLQKRNWVENKRRRVTRVDRIYMNGDSKSDIYIDVKRLIHMEMRDTITGDHLMWDYGA